MGGKEGKAWTETFTCATDAADLWPQLLTHAGETLLTVERKSLEQVFEAAQKAGS